MTEGTNMSDYGCGSGGRYLFLAPAWTTNHNKANDGQKLTTKLLTNS